MVQFGLDGEDDVQGDHACWLDTGTVTVTQVGSRMKATFSGTGECLVAVPGGGHEEGGAFTIHIGTLDATLAG